MAVEVVRGVGRGFAVCSLNTTFCRELSKPAGTSNLLFGDAAACSSRQVPSGQSEDAGCRPLGAACSKDSRARLALNLPLRDPRLSSHQPPGWTAGNTRCRFGGQRHCAVHSRTNSRTKFVEAGCSREPQSFTHGPDSSAAPTASNVQPASEGASEKGHRKQTHLFSVAALPSVAAVLYAPLAAGDFAVHLQLTVPDLGVAIFTAAAALAWVRLFDELARRNVFERKLSRKLVHISSGLLFMLFWPVFSSNPDSRLYAALVPAANLVRLAAVGTGLLKSEDTVKAISRDGDKRELLGGPLYYVIVLIVVTVCFWRQSPIGVSALALMCAGDGIADIAGRRFGKGLKLPYNKSKSWAGSAAMFVTGTATALLYVTYFCNFGFYECNMLDTAVKVAGIALAATIVESLPITDRLDDNITVPLTCVAVGSLLFPA